MKFSWSCLEFKMKFEIVTTKESRFHFTGHNELLSKGIEFFRKLKGIEFLPETQILDNIIYTY